MSDNEVLSLLRVYCAFTGSALAKKRFGIEPVPKKNMICGWLEDIENLLKRLRGI